jgi:hypothetical protein
MDWDTQFFIILGLWLVWAVVAYFASRSGHRWRSRLSKFAAGGSVVGLALALLSQDVLIRVWMNHQASVSPSLAHASFRLFVWVGEYAPLSGALAGGIIGCILAYVARGTKAA